MTKESFVARGDANGRSKLTTAQVLELRERYSRRSYIGQRVTMKSLSAQFGITVSHCWRILHREVWTHV